VRHGEAAVHIEDRGYQLADGVYEVWAVFDGKLADADGHFTRLWRSLDELRIAHPMSEKALTVVLREAVRRNKVREGLVYLQVTRGVAPRDHAFPNPPAAVVVVTAKSRRPRRHRGQGRQGRVGDHGARRTAGAAATSSRSACCPTPAWPSRRPASAARSRPGSSTTWAWSPKAPRPTPGSSTPNGVLRTRDTQANILRGITRSACWR
jgi:D-alanine transaminase